jgi:Peptidase family S41
VRLLLALLVPALVVPILLGRMFKAPNPAPASGALTPEELREDFAILQGALEEGHPGIYRYTSKAELDRIFAQAVRSLDHPRTGLELYRIAAPVVAAIKCGHTKISPPEAVRQEIRRQLLPLQVKVLDRKPYVLRDLANADRHLAGAEIRSVNGVPAERIVTALLAATPGDGDVMTSRQIDIGGFHFAEGLRTLLDLRSPYEVALTERGTGRLETVRLAGADLGRLTEAAAAQSPRVSQRPSLDLLDGGRIAVVRIPEFSGLSGFLADAFGEMQAKKTAALVLDLRGNGGGDDDQGKLLLSYLLGAPFQYYSDLVLNKTSFRFAKYVSRCRPRASPAEPTAATISWATPTGASSSRAGRPSAARSSP